MSPKGVTLMHSLTSIQQMEYEGNPRHRRRTRLTEEEKAARQAEKTREKELSKQQRAEERHVALGGLCC